MYNAAPYNSVPYNASLSGDVVSSPSAMYDASPYNAVTYNGIGVSGAAPSAGVTYGAVATESVQFGATILTTIEYGAAVSEGAIFNSSINSLNDGLLAVVFTVDAATEHTWGFGRACSELINVSTTAEELMALLAAESISISDVLLTAQTMYPSLHESISFTDKVQIARTGLLTDVVNMSATSAGAKYFVAVAVEHLLISNVASGHADAVAVLAEAIIMDETLAQFFGADLAEALSVSAGVEVSRAAIASAIENIVLVDSIVNYAIIVGLIDEVVELNANLTFNQVIAANLAEDIAFFMSVPIGDDLYSGWVMNTKTHDVSEYSNYPFNSYCNFNGKFLAASSKGLYELGGDADGTEPIAASFSSGVSDFGSSKLKRAERVYLGYRADGKLALKVTTGEQVERWYELEASKTEEGVHEARIKLGKGVKSRYWQFSVSNKDGADFDIDSFEFVEINLSRKVRR